MVNFIAPRDVGLKQPRSRKRIREMLKTPERRTNPRIDHELPVYLTVNGYDFATTTENVSCTGAYCRINKYVPPFTKLAIKMTLPVLSQGKKEKLNVACKGVIVRSEDGNKKNSFNIAIFFNEIKDNQRKKISQYISQFLPKEPACSKS